MTKDHAICDRAYWIATKKAVSGADAQAADLGRRAHVLKVLQKSFRGIDVTCTPATWKQGKLTLLFDLGTHERVKRLEIEVQLHSCEISEAVAFVSPRFRRLGETNFWAVVDRDGAKIDWQPAKRMPRRRKGLVKISLTNEKLLEHLRAGPGVSCMFGGFETVKQLDDFLHGVTEGIDREKGKLLYPSTVGWTNLEIAPPSGVSFFQVTFGGERGAALFDVFVAAARRAGHPLASFEDEKLVLKDQTFSIGQCQGTLHNVWESSLQKTVEQEAQAEGPPPAGP